MSRPKIKSSEPRIERRGGARRRPTVMVDGDEVHAAREPKHEPTPFLRYQVDLLASHGCQHSIIARIVGVNESTLVRHYRDELQTGRARAVMAVAGALWKIACGNTERATQAQIFWLKTRGGPAFQIADKSEVSGPDGAPVQVEGTAGLEELAKQFFTFLQRVRQTGDSEDGSEGEKA